LALTCATIERLWRQATRCGPAGANADRRRALLVHSAGEDDTSAPPGSRLADALALALRVHHGQRRKGTETPVLAHLLAVAAIALEHGADEETAIGALLHDAVEDGGGEPLLAEIRGRFGERVARIVADASDAILPPGHPKPPWRERKERHLGRLETVPGDSLLVLAADKLANVRTIVRDVRHDGEEVWGRFEAGKADILWYQQSMLALLRRRGVPAKLRRELEEAVAALEEIAST
jgi:(p)ppGpp synthase/HD superfamily hydrolase